MKDEIRLPRIGSRGLVEQAVEALRKRIVGGKFGPGAVLPSQGDLSRTLGVSRSVVREAMRILQSQGLVEVSQGRQPRVRPAGLHAVIESLSTLLERSSASLLDLIEARRPIESEIAALAAERATGEDIAALEAALLDLKRSRSLEDGVEADVRFHQALARATRNPIFEWFLETLARLLRESRRRTIAASGAGVPLRHHARILRAVKEGDPEEARQAMAHHLAAARGDLLRSEGGR